MQRALFEAMIAARRRGQPLALVTDLTGGAQCLLVTGAPPEGGLVLSPTDIARVEAARAADRSGVLDPAEAGLRLFVQVEAPPARVLIVGAVHIAQALAPMAALTGYAVTVIDPRGAFAESARLPGVVLDARWPDEAMAALAPDGRTAVVTLTHDPKLDDPALLVALPSPAFYVGALGSSRTHAKRVERLGAAGLHPAVIARLHAPIGLRIAAKSPAEIAVAILAELTSVRRGGASTTTGDDTARSTRVA